MFSILSGLLAPEAIQLRHDIVDSASRGRIRGLIPFLAPKQKRDVYAIPTWFS
jgi:hypothetical protein